ncbi:MAG TPA: glycosyltransferase family 2 protein, partial [Actinoplanes sp.]|nr:glycosyltransferase family 2 protein [Actinoplanes sp.]
GAAEAELQPGPASNVVAGTDLTISVVICAYTLDRWSVLCEACESVRAQLREHDELILIIDHNDELLARAREALTGILVVPNADTRGLSGARNTGVEVGKGRIVAFLDDDATARPGWLESVRAGFTTASTAVVGTRVEPRWEGDRKPRWFPAEFGWVVGCSYRGQPTTRSAVRNPIGASMAIRRTAFAVAGTFSQVVGRVGALPVGCEETEFCIRLAHRQPEAQVVFHPETAVDHLVPRQRQTVRYFLSRCFHEGRSKRAVARLSGAGAALSSERAYVRVTLPAAVLRGISPTTLRREPAAFLQAIAVVAGLTATVAGYVSAARPRGVGKGS